MPEFDERYSQLLVECGGNLVPFLDSVFGFLYRRSDFFRLKSDKNDAESVVGFHAGQNKNLLLAVFNKWNKFAIDEDTKDLMLAQAEVPIAVSEEEVVTEPSKPEAKAKPKIEEKKEMKWTQTSSDIEITLPVDKSVVKGSQVKISCTKSNLKVQLSSGQVLMDGEFTASVKASELVWTLMPSSHLSINLEKAREGPTWAKLFQSDTEDLSKLETPQQPLAELKESDRMAVEYALAQQSKKEQKDDQDLEKILKQAWNQEGSPFAGQPFDPSILSNMKK